MFLLVTEGLIYSFSSSSFSVLRMNKSEDGDDQVTPPISVKSDDLILSADYQVRAILGSARVITVRC